MANNEWLYSTGDEHQQGPVSTRELNRLAESGTLRPDDLIWKEGMAEWVPANRLKGLSFEPPQQNGPPSRPTPRRFDADTLQSTFRDAQLRADEAAGTLWFLDLKFSRFVAATIIRVIWCAWLAVVAFGMAIGLLGLIFNEPVIQVVLFSAVGIILAAFMTLMFRVFLETFMVVFRMAEHLRDMNEKLATK